MSIALTLDQLIAFYQNNQSLILTAIAVLLYVAYYRKYAFYICHQVRKKLHKKKIGKTVPYYPNGWFVVARSHELKPKDVKHVAVCGQNFVVFRGTDGKAYALDAYCAHMGANLGVGGEVTYGNCVQCPFHGWTFDGETGNCVLGPGKEIKKGLKCKYEEKKDKNGNHQVSFEKEKEEEVKIKKWIVMEVNGLIHVWIHALEEKRLKPEYEPLDISPELKKLSHRGYSVNYAHSHTCEIPENGADILHFIYVHNRALKHTSLIKSSWNSAWCRGDDPKLLEKLKHKDPKFQAEKARIINTYLTEKAKSRTGVMTLDMTMKIPVLGDLYIFNATVFQVGPGVVYLFLQSPFFTIIFIQHMRIVEKFKQEIYHEIYSNKVMPYWLSAFFLFNEQFQVSRDVDIWDNKKFGYSAYYKDSDPDNTLIYWRKWYSQFFEGAEEASKHTLDW